MNDITELRTLVARHAASSTGQRIVNGLMVAQAASPTPPVHSVHQPVFALVAQGAKRIVLADRVFDARAGEFSVVPLDLPLTFRVTEATEDTPYYAVAMLLDPRVIAALLLDAVPVDYAVDEPNVIGVSSAPIELVDAVARLVRLLDRPADAPILRPMIEREIVWRLLCSDQGMLVRQIGLADSRLARVSQAIRWIRENFAEPLRVEDLARRVAMSPTSFHRHFRAATAMSPLQYQKRIRLQEARTRLMARTDDVAGVGFSVGYDSPSQFSREYARLFGAPPSRDAADLRATPSSA